MPLLLKQKKTGLKIISIVMSLLLWAYVVNSGSEASGRNLLQVPLEYRHVPSGLTVKGPEQVAVRLWGVVQKNASIKAYVDLADCQAGIFEVPVQLESGSGAILSVTQPRRVQVQLSSVLERVFTVSHQVLRGPPAGYELLGVSVSPDKCLVKGEETELKRIEQVVAQIDLSQATDMTAYTGNLMALDAEGQVIAATIALQPEQATIHAVVAPLLDTREVPVTVATAGQVAAGFQVTAVSTQPGTAKIMGHSGAIAGIDDVRTELVDLTDKTISFQQEVSLQSPDTVRVFPEQLLVNVTIGAVESSEEDEEGDR